MAGILYTEAAAIDANSGRMLVTFTSAGEDFRFHLPAYIALLLRERILRNGWQVCCAPNAQTVSLSARRAQAKRDSRFKREAL